MVSRLRATDIPADRVDVLHILRLNGDDPDRLSQLQREAICRIYRINGDNRSIEILILDGEL